MSKTYSYSAYLTWRFKERIEIIKGKIFPMSAPSLLHQQVSGELHFQIIRFLKKELEASEVFSAPFDVRLPGNPDLDRKKYDVVQPDLCVICDPAKLDKKGAIGAPDLVVEILSPSSSRRDLKDKYEIYETYGVHEYWVVHPSGQTRFIP